MTSVDTQGNTQSHVLGKVLPGQRFVAPRFDEAFGTRVWRRAFEPYPALLRNEKRCIMTCVDEIFLASQREYVTNAVIPKFNQKYKIRHDLVEEPGGELSFLQGSVIIQPHVNQTARLFELRGIKPTLHSKKTPAHPEINEPDVSKSFSTLVQMSLNASLSFDI